jgi:hypothetical protein
MAHRNPKTAPSAAAVKKTAASAAAVKALNSDCLQEIFLHLPLRDLLSAARVCRQWHQASNGSRVWATQVLSRFGADFWDEFHGEHPYKPEDIPRRVNFRAYSGGDRLPQLRERCGHSPELARFAAAAAAEGWKATYRYYSGSHRVFSHQMKVPAKHDTVFLISGAAAVRELAFDYLKNLAGKELREAHNNTKQTKWTLDEAFDWRPQKQPAILLPAVPTVPTSSEEARPAASAPSSGSASALSDAATLPPTLGACKVLRGTLTGYTPYPLKGEPMRLTALIVPQPRHWQLRYRQQTAHWQHLIYCVDALQMLSTPVETSRIDRELHGILAEGRQCRPGTFLLICVANTGHASVPPLPSIARLLRFHEVMIPEHRGNCPYHSGPVMAFFTPIDDPREFYSGLTWLLKQPSARPHWGSFQRGRGFLAKLIAQPKNTDLEYLEVIGHAITADENGVPEDHYNHFWEEESLNWADFNEYMDASKEVKQWAAEDYKCSF